MTNHSPYVELRARSAFSFLEGATAPEELVETAAALGYDAIALGDRDGLYGAPRFYQAATQAGLKAIVGVELTLDEPSFGMPGASPYPARLYLLVPDRARYKNLCRMITAAKLRLLGEYPDGTPRYPAKGESRITLGDLERFGEGMICLGGGALSPISRSLTRGDNPQALAATLSGIFGRGNFYIDLQRHLDPDEERLNRKLAAFARAAQVPIVASNDVSFTASPSEGPRHATAALDSERALLDVMTCIRLGTTLEEAGRALWSNHERQLKPPAEMTTLFLDMPEAISATRDIAAQCAFTLKDLGYRFPDYPIPYGETPDSYLRALTNAGGRERWGTLDDRIRRQLEHELNIIARLKLAGYFLIVWDIVQFCREHRIMAQGRGSAANSAVCYALGITAIDAVKMELLFERFLSEERGEWPDIDIDLPSGDQREQVIQYVYKRYGERAAAMTANVITYRVRSAVRETAKVLGFPPDQVDRLAKLNYVYEFQDQHDEFTALLRKGDVDPEAPRIRMLTTIVQRLQGLPRHLGQHSGGMVIGAGPLDEIVPLEPATMPGRVVVQWDKEDCADLGIIKIDLLGLGMLAVLEEAIPLVREHEGIEVDLAHIPADDAEVYAMLQQADTVGVFQVESRAQMATLPRLKPKSFYDLVVEIAIIRPGPIVGKMVHPYLDRRAGRAPVKYDHDLLKPILRRTLGVPLFQEQLLRMAMTVAGFSAGEAEELRRAMGFKRSTVRMKELGQRLRDGMARNDIRGATAERIIQSITSFALYGFPESHSASFALIAYASAYLKCHHPAAFCAAMLNCYPLGFYHPATLLKDAQRHGVTVLAIDVMRSDWKCTIERIEQKPAMRLGLKYVGGLGEETGRRIECARSERPFNSIADFSGRVKPSQRELDAIAYAGAFAVFDMNRREALWQAAAVERDPSSLLAGAEPSRRADGEVTDNPKLPGMTPTDETLADYAASSVTIGPHLMAHLRPRLAARGVLSAVQLAEATNGSWVKCAGVVIVRQRPGTASGFMFLTLEDETGLANAIVTPDIFQANRTILHRAQILIVEGPLQKQDGVIHIRARRFTEVNAEGTMPRSHDFR